MHTLFWIQACSVVILIKQCFANVLSLPGPSQIQQTMDFRQFTVFSLRPETHLRSRATFQIHKLKRNTREGGKKNEGKCKIFLISATFYLCTVNLTLAIHKNHVLASAYIITSENNSPNSTSLRGRYIQ